MKNLNLAKITLDESLQQRVAINQKVVSEYASLLSDGYSGFAPLEVIHDVSRDTYWLVDGFHRYHAFTKAGFKEVPIIVTEGTKRDAVLASVKANASNGLQRTNADKNKSVAALLNDEEWRHWSNRQIAEHIGVSHEFVRKLKEELAAANGWQMDKIQFQKNGKKFEQVVPLKEVSNTKKSSGATTVTETETESSGLKNSMQSVEDINESQMARAPEFDLTVTIDEEYELKKHLTDYASHLAKELFQAKKSKNPDAFTKSDLYLSAVVRFANDRGDAFSSEVRKMFINRFYQLHVPELVNCLKNLTKAQKRVVKSFLNLGDSEVSAKELRESLDVDSDSISLEEVTQILKEASQPNGIGVTIRNRKYLLNHETKDIFKVLMEYLPANDAFHKEWFESSTNKRPHTKNAEVSNETA